MTTYVNTYKTIMYNQVLKSAINYPIFFEPQPETTEKTIIRFMLILT